MAIIRFHKALQKYTNGTSFIEMENDTYLGILLSLKSIFCDLDKVFNINVLEKNRHEEIVLIVNGKILPLDNLLFSTKDDDTVIIVPIFYGEGKIGTIIAIVAIVAIAIWQPQLFFAAAEGFSSISAAAAAGAGVLGTGIGGFTLLGQIAFSIAFSLVQSLFAPKPPNISISSAPDTEARRNNDAFDGLKNTTHSNALVLLNYGQNRIAGHLISGYIKTINHGKNDLINVGDQFSG